MSLPKPYYQDGQATIYCGDARGILPLLDAASIDMVFTDPPYGHNNNNGDLIANREAALGHGKSGPPRPIANDGAEANDLVRFAFDQFNRLLKPGCCCCCCCCGGGPDPQFSRWSLWMDDAIGFKQAAVWDKGGLGMGWHYRRSYEFILVGEKPGAACRWFGGNKQSNVVRIPKILPQADDHPTPKPVELCGLFIRLHSAPGDIVLDPFMGHCSTGAAAKMDGRNFIGIELEEKYCAVAVERLSQAVFALPEPEPPKVETGALFDA